MSISIKIKKDFGDFNLDIAFESDRKRIGILGVSGSGKSMTLKAIAGIQEIEDGYIEINGSILTDTSNKVFISPQQRRVGYMFQNYALFPTQTVKKNIMAGLVGPKFEREEKANEMIEKFSLVGMEDRLPGELSGGQQQRVALARIMAYEPEVILLDEPFSALDGFLKEKLQQELMEMLSDYEGTVILVSHNRDEIYSFCNDVIVLDRGQVSCIGDRLSIFRNPGNAVTARLTGCKNIVEVNLIDNHSFYIPDWNITIHTESAIPDGVISIGYRAHDFMPIWKERDDNCIEVKLKNISEFPFEHKYYLNSGGEDICWYVHREPNEEIIAKGIPKYLKILEEKILYLK
ncbi:MAG: sulfate/molybdate ABC transporter ATP-binding protein [Suipraeoptans sp.]